MLFFIDSSDYEKTKLALVGKQLIMHEFESKNLSETLSSEIKKFLKKQKINFDSIKKIAVVVGPGGFSRIRSAVASANALAFGLKVSIVGINKDKLPKELYALVPMPGKKMIVPYYDREPNITLSNKTI